MGIVIVVIHRPVMAALPLALALDLAAMLLAAPLFPAPFFPAVIPAVIMAIAVVMGQQRCGVVVGHAGQVRPWCGGSLLLGRGDDQGRARGLHLRG